jgi:hypothetical protein
MCRIRHGVAVSGRPEQLRVILYNHTIQDNGDEGRPGEPVTIKARRFPDNIVDLPFARLAAGIDQRRPLAIDAAGKYVYLRREVLQRGSHDDHDDDGG